MSEENTAKPIAEQILTQTWNTPVKLQVQKELGGSSRSHVYRCTVIDGPNDAPQTVVVKQTVSVGDEKYEPDKTGGSAARLFNDWTGLQLLTDVLKTNSPAPTFFGGNRQAGVIVMEDFGDCTQLDHVLLGEDANAAESGLMALATSLGKMHAATANQKDTYQKIRTNLGPLQPPADLETLRNQGIQKLQDIAEAIGIEPHPNIKEDATVAAQFFTPESPFAAYIHHDPCPDNCLIVGDELKLLDFEFGQFDNALIDGVYGRIHFPSCWCVNRFPEHIFLNMEKIYRSEFIKGCDAAKDDDLYHLGITASCATAIIQRWYNNIMKEDGRWGIATHRQRILVRFDIFAQTTETFGVLEATGKTIKDAATKLRTLWPKETDAMPLYPAFR